MEIVNKKISEIRPYDNNPRHNDAAIEAVANSIREFGWQQPIVIDHEGVIVVGHTRYLAARYLGQSTVPCKVIEQGALTDEQIKAYRLADNKTNELASWDISALIEEIDSIPEVDMSLFGFEFKLNEHGETLDDADEDEDSATPDEPIRGGQALNFYDGGRVTGFYDMPMLEPVDFTPTDLIGFNYLLNTNRRDCGIHFYLDDYQFERFWNSPEQYLTKMREFECVLTPDFSLFLDMSMSAKIWNTYRSRLLGQIMQDRGINVIPTVSWAEPDTFEFCFDGIPKHSTVSISTIGVIRYDENWECFEAGASAMMEILEPKRILLYGEEIDFDWGDAEIVKYQNNIVSKWRGGV